MLSSRPVTHIAVDRSAAETTEAGFFEFKNAPKYELLISQTSSSSILHGFKGRRLLYRHDTLYLALADEYREGCSSLYIINVALSELISRRSP